MNQDSIIVFTDGSSSGNPGPGGWAAIVACPARNADCDVMELGGRETLTTNNRMELKGVIEAFIFIGQKKGTVTIHTDSSYVIQGITKWVKGWVSRGWITSTKEPVSNQDLWQQLLKLVEEREQHSQIVWKQIEGHAGVPGNERADIIATAFTANQNPDLYNGPQSAYPINLFVTDSSRTKKVVKDQKRNRSNQKAFSYVSRVGGVVYIDKTWAECEARVKGMKGVRFKKALSAEEEKEIVADFQKGV